MTAPPSDPDMIDEREAGSNSICVADPARSYVGQKATSAIGAAVLKATGAEILRWGPPDAVFTMDFRRNRVNVMYDAVMTITEIRCG